MNLLTTLLYGSKCWRLTEQGRLPSFHTASLRRIQSKV